MIIDIHYPFKYVHVLFVCFALAEMFSFYFQCKGFASKICYVFNLFDIPFRV